MTAKRRPVRRKKKSGGAGLSRRRRIILAILSLLGVLLIGAGLIGYRYYRLIFRVNVDLGSRTEMYVFIPSGSGFDDVKAILYNEGVIIDRDSFEWLAMQKGYSEKVRSGRYLLTDGMSNNQLINMLRSGRQEPVKLTFNNIRTTGQLVSRISKQIEADSAELLKLLTDEAYLGEFGFTPENVRCMFIPDTYEIFWDTPADKFIRRMFREYEKFWTEKRRNKAESLGLSPQQVVILASIVAEETRKSDEMPRVAGVYINRLNQGMPLQADPTLKFAIGDFSMKRILLVHTRVESPYNTYIHAGLPPGPICFPSPKVVDHVLDAENHDYLYFCARDDFSGYHVFAKTLAQHNQNAAKYHAALNRRKIKK